jgi:hypothetical protein
MSGVCHLVADGIHEVVIGMLDVSLASGYTLLGVLAEELLHVLAEIVHPML